MSVITFPFVCAAGVRVVFGGCVGYSLFFMFLFFLCLG